MTIALIGPPNVGKTTLFNRLTGSGAEIGNRPGVTVEALVGKAVFDKNILIADLPGIYSLNTYTQDEREALSYISGGSADRLICVADATNPERAVALALSLSRFTIPMVLAVNLYDALTKRGGRADIEKLSSLTGITCVALSSRGGLGVDSLCRAVMTARRPAPNIFVPSPEGLPFKKRGPSDEGFSSPEELFRRASDITKACFDMGTGRSRLTHLLDNTLSSAPLSLTIFALAVFTVFFLSFGPPGRFLGDCLSVFLSRAIAGSHAVLTGVGLPDFFTSLICEGFLTGLFSILSFMPQLSVMFLSLSLLEESGYLSRAAVLTDSFFKRFNLSGKSAVSFLLGFGCSVPAIMSARGIRSRRERVILISVLPFVSCGARLPVYWLIASVLFPGAELPVIFSLYVLGAFTALFYSRHSRLSGDDGLFFIELPEYRMPDLKSVFKLTFTRVYEFFSRSAPALSAAFCIFWFMKTYNFDLSPVLDGRFGMLGSIGRALCFVLRPAGFGFWQACVALICGFMAKEAIVGVFAVIAGGSGAQLAGAILLMFSPASALSFLVFVLLYTPCVSTLKTMHRELKSRRAVFLYTLRQLLTAYFASIAVFQLYSLVSRLF